MNNILVSSQGTLSFHGQIYRCALGRGGVKADKQEGDGATPLGSFAMRKVFYRPDKFTAPPVTKLPLEALESNSGWSDDSALPDYNCYVQLPYTGSHEQLWRADDLYDIIVVLAYNDAPVMLGKGSAIFMHIAREAYTPTDGCIALSQPDLLALLAGADANTRVEIKL